MQPHIDVNQPASQRRAPFSADGCDRKATEITTLKLENCGDYHRDFRSQRSKSELIVCPRFMASCQIAAR